MEVRIGHFLFFLFTYPIGYDGWSQIRDSNSREEATNHFSGSMIHDTSISINVLVIVSSSL